MFAEAEQISSTEQEIIEFEPCNDEDGLLLYNGRLQKCYHMMSDTLSSSLETIMLLHLLSITTKKENIWQKQITHDLWSNHKLYKLKYESWKDNVINVVVTKPYQQTIDWFRSINSYEAAITRTLPNSRWLWRTFYCAEKGKIKNIDVSVCGVKGIASTSCLRLPLYRFVSKRILPKGEVYLKKFYQTTEQILLVAATRL